MARLVAAKYGRRSRAARVARATMSPIVLTRPRRDNAFIAGSILDQEVA